MFYRAAAILAAFFLSIGYTQYPAAEPEPEDLRGKIVILDAGHGRGNTNTYAGYDEHATMLKLAHKIKPALEARGAAVLLTRPTQEDVALPVRAALINKWALEAVKEARQRELLGAAHGTFAGSTDKLQSDIRELDRLLGIVQSVIDYPAKNAPIYLNTPYDYTYKRKIHPEWQKVFEYENDPEIWNRFLVISLHSNATPKPINTAAHGAEAYYASNSAYDNVNYYAAYSHEARNVYFCELLLNKLDTLGLRKRYAEGTNYLMIREHNLPGALVENGFHTNQQDRAKLSDDAFLDKLALAYADVIEGYFFTYSP